MRRAVPALLALAFVAGSGWPAAAHAPATLVMTSPAEGARLPGPTVRVVIAGQGGRDAAVFKLDLDGRSVDATGRIGGVFSTLSVEPGQRLELDLPVEPGDHTLTATPNADPDAEQVTVVRRFTVVAAAGTPSGAGNGAEDGDDVIGVDFVPAAVVVAALAAVVGAGVVWRKRRPSGPAR